MRAGDFVVTGKFSGLSDYVCVRVCVYMCMYMCVFVHMYISVYRVYVCVCC